MPDPLGEFSHVWPLYAALVLGYLAGSIPFGLILTRIAGMGDVRAIGSGSIGATNVLRTGSKPLAAATLLLDGGKGALAVLAAATFGPDMAFMAAVGALVGHCAPVWLKFRGGKGVATAIGILLAISWPVGLLVCATWLAVAALFRFSSLASMIGIGASPLYAYWLDDRQWAELALFIAVVVIFRHWSNIARLFKGKEPKIGKKQVDDEPT